MKPNPDFRLKTYGDALKRELESFGFTVEFLSKEKELPFNIDSAFLKTNTKLQLLSIGISNEFAQKIHARKELKIKLEIDIDPPSGFQTEVRTLLRPIPHAVKVYTFVKSTGR